MPEEIKSDNVKSDEIDLLDLFNRIGRWFGRMFRGIGKLFLVSFFFLLKKWLWLGLSIAIGIGASYLLKFTSKRFYSSEMTIRSNAAGNSDVIAYVNKFHTFCKEKNFSELASALTLDENKVRYIKDIEAFWVVDLGNDYIPDFVDYKRKHDPLDTVNVFMQDRFVIRVKTSIPRELGEIRNGLISYIEKNGFFRQQNELRQKQNEALLARFNYEIESLDSLQKVKYFEESRRLSPKEGGQMIFLQEYKTQLLHDDILNIYQRRQEVERQLTVFNGVVTVLSEFTPPAKPVNRALYYGRFIIPAIFILAIILLIYIDNIDKFREAYNKY